MPVPATREELMEAGWRYCNNGRCKGCGAEIEWWRSFKNKAAPMTVLDPVLRDGQLVYLRQSHFIDCPAKDQFRKAKKKR